MAQEKDRLGIAYERFFAELTVSPPSENAAEFRYNLQETARNRLTGGQLNLQLCLKAGEVLETAKKQIVLGSERVELGPDDIGGWIRHHGWTLHVDPSSRLTWPVYPFNPYRDGPETSLAHAVGALSTPLKVKDDPGSQFRAQDIAFRLEISKDQGRRTASENEPKELPYDRPIKKYLAEQAREVERELLPGIHNGAEFDKVRPAYREKYLYMLGLSPMPERTPLHATVTGKLDRAGYTVEKLHFQSSPGLYVTANLYLPKNRQGRTPTILYLCGHASQMKRDGNKAAPECQSHAIWFATHGYVALVLDTLELGEIAAMHRGTLKHNRWWWHSAGYTPAGVECWNAIRAIDYLVSRPEVDPERIGATGISGGGAVSFWIAAADERVKAVAPVSGMGDVTFYAGEGGMGVHCDCITCYNQARWNGATIAALIAPRPLMFVNSDNDVYFPMAPNERLQNRLERIYSLFGASDVVESILSMGGHGYRTDIRRAVYGFFNRHLKLDARRVEDPDAHVTGRGAFPIKPSDLRVFPTDADLPTDQLNTRIDEVFVARGKTGLPTPETFESWRSDLLARLKNVTFGAWPSGPPRTQVPSFGERPSEGTESTEDGIDVAWRWLPGKDAAAAPLMIVLNPSDDPGKLPAWASKLAGQGSVLVLCPRGVGPVAWTRGEFPNTIERSFPLLGATSDSGRVWDVAVVARRHKLGSTHWRVAGEGQAGLIGAYAALFEPNIGEILLVNPPSSHQPRNPNQPYGPPLLNVLRVLDVPEALGCLAPRRLVFLDAEDKAFDKTAALYRLAGASEHLSRTHSRHASLNSGH
jgi:cephalosporin-C deacetylase-like acetyl esterase